MDYVSQNRGDVIMTRIAQTAPMNNTVVRQVRLQDCTLQHCSTLHWNIMIFSMLCLFIADTTSTYCGGDQFQCADSGMCVDLIYRCDGQHDCLDQSDEKHCNGKRDHVSDSEILRKHIDSQI